MVTYGIIMKNFNRQWNPEDFAWGKFKMQSFGLDIKNVVWSKTPKYQVSNSLKILIVLQKKKNNVIRITFNVSNFLLLLICNDLDRPCKIKT